MTTDRLTTVGAAIRRLLAVSIAGIVAAVAAGAHAQEGAGKDEKSAAARLARIVISFKLDPALTRSMYMGDRWVSPLVYSSTNQPGDSATVEARVYGVDATGSPVPIEPVWALSDPTRLSVTPGEHGNVKITVRGAGESRLRVSAGEVSKELAIKGVQKNNGTHAEIAQSASPAVAEAHGPKAREDQKPQSETVVTGDPALRDAAARNSYVAGVRMGTALRETAADLDADLVARGVKDALTGAKNPLTADEMKAALAALRSDFETKRVEARTLLAEKNKKEGEAFLAENKTREGVVALESGLQYKILKAGDGARPAVRDRVVCQYRGSLIDGTEFDNSFKGGKSITLPLTRVIKGWSQALQLMPVGSKWQLFVPPSLAYGERGGRKNGIGPNATLVFEVELLSIQEPARAAAKHDATSPRASSNAAHP
jgi:FKBP-type peptidyl-prolyl cis-trans isomerase FklB